MINDHRAHFTLTSAFLYNCSSKTSSHKLSNKNNENKSLTLSGINNAAPQQSVDKPAQICRYCLIFGSVTKALTEVILACVQRINSDQAANLKVSMPRTISNEKPCVGCSAALSDDEKTKSEANKTKPPARILFRAANSNKIKTA